MPHVSGREKTTHEGILGNSLSVHIEEAVVTPFLIGGRGDDALNLSAIDSDNDSCLLKGVGGSLGGLVFHGLDTVDQRFGFTDGERGHFDKGSAGLGPADSHIVAPLCCAKRGEGQIIWQMEPVFRPSLYPLI